MARLKPIHHFLEKPKDATYRMPPTCQMHQTVGPAHQPEPCLWASVSYTETDRGKCINYSQTVLQKQVNVSNLFQTFPGRDNTVQSPSAESEQEMDLFPDLVTLSRTAERSLRGQSDFSEAGSILESKMEQAGDSEGSLAPRIWFLFGPCFYVRVTHICRRGPVGGHF